MRYCIDCYKPQEEEQTKCSYCQSELFVKVYNPENNYTLKQWEKFIDSFKGGALHDFSPWEFNEDGSLKPRGGYSTGPQTPPNHKKIKGNLENENHMGKSKSFNHQIKNQLKTNGHKDIKKKNIKSTSHNPKMKKNQINHSKRK